MPNDQNAREAQLRAIKVYGRTPALAQSTCSATAEVGDGLICTFTEGDTTLISDMPAAVGGGGSAPTPGVFARAGIANCVATGIKMTAIRERVKVDRVTVHLDIDFDDRGLFAMDGAVPDPLAARMSIELQSDAPASDLSELVERALDCDPWFLAYRDRQAIEYSIQTTKGST